MLGRLKKRFILKIGNLNRKSFLKNVPDLIANIPQKTINVDMISMSGKKSFEDQLFSLLSFYFNAGTPVSWTIYNDGSYSDTELNIFIKIPCVKVIMLPTDRWSRETEKYPTLKKLFILESVIPVRPVIYSDSDVLFFKKFNQLTGNYISANCYLVDEGEGYFDNDFSDIPVAEPLNLGLMILNTVPHWHTVRSYIDAKIKENKLAYWTDQTACHIMAQQESFSPLPKDKFVVGGKDAFKINHDVNYKEIAVRHFVGPVRHKMWQISWKIFLRAK